MQPDVVLHCNQQHPKREVKKESKSQSDRADAEIDLTSAVRPKLASFSQLFLLHTPSPS